MVSTGRYNHLSKFISGSWAVAFAVALMVTLPICCLGPAAGDRQVPASQNLKKITSFESLVLKRRNWESHGTDVKIEQGGSFTVTAVFLGSSKLVRAGILEKKQIDMLLELINNANIASLPKELKAPFKTKSEWWGYELTLKEGPAINSVRFHSENDSVPESLNRLLETIQSLTQ